MSGTKITNDIGHDIKKGLSFISNRQRRKEGTFGCVGVGGDRTHASRPGGAGYARLSPTRLGGIYTYTYGKQVESGSLS